MLTRITAFGVGVAAQRRTVSRHCDSGWRQLSVVAMTSPLQ